MKRTNRPGGDPDARPLCIRRVGLHRNRRPGRAGHRSAGSSLIWRPTRVKTPSVRRASSISLISLLHLQLAALLAGEIKFSRPLFRRDVKLP